MVVTLAPSSILGRRSDDHIIILFSKSQPCDRFKTALGEHRSAEEAQGSTAHPWLTELQRVRPQPPASCLGIELC